MPTVCHSSTLNSRLLDLNSTEQSQNVYENKGRGREVMGGPAQTLLLNVCDAPKAQFSQVVPLTLTCPFGRHRRPHTSGSAPAGLGC